MVELENRRNAVKELRTHFRTDCQIADFFSNELE